MRREKLFLFAILLLVISACKNEIADNTKFVNPFVGTGGKGHTYPGASLPFGMVQLSPDNGIGGWDEISGYFYDHNTIAGFSHTHLTGTGVGDMYDFSFMPVVAPAKYGKINPKKPDVGVFSTFSHDKEHAEPGYYKVFLEDYKVLAELTATERCGIHRYSFPTTDQAQVILDLGYSRNWNFVQKTDFKLSKDGVASGLIYSTGWAKNQKSYFAAEFSQKFKDVEITKDSIILPKTKEFLGYKYKAIFKFDTKKEKPLILRVGISYADEAGALKNLREEVKTWDFDYYKNSANKIWRQHLAKIDVKSSIKDVNTLFYTFLYQAQLAPTLYEDVDGRYWGPNGKINKSKGFKNYCRFSLWDTYRAAHPLYTIIQPNRVNDMVKSMLDFSDQYGLLPVWPLAGSETGMMIGYHSVPVIADAVTKGIGNFDKERALKACIKAANSDVEGLPLYKKYKYIPYEDEIESVSKTQEYSYDDWAIAKFAETIGKKETANEYYERADYMFNLFDKETSFFRPKDKKGNWLKEFKPRDYSEHYCESNAWQYLFHFQHDVEKAIKYFGGKEKFAGMLDKMFNSHVTEDEDLPLFSTGMIGQYVHGNEPSHHVAYLYNYVGQPWKTQEMVRKIMKELYFNKPDGISGNEDCGQMASWYVLSALGFYPVNPVGGVYDLGSPSIDYAKINLDNGKVFEIEAKNNSDKNVYVKSVTFNGKNYDKLFITHDQILSGGKLVFEMTDKPVK
jgi:predicted alpha-1,2-mannosidase